MRSAISRWLGVSVSSMPANHRTAAEIDSAAASLMLLRAILTASASGFRRAPSHTSQVFAFW